MKKKLSDLLNRLVLTERGMTTKVEDAKRINQEPVDYEKVDELLKAHSREIAKIT